MTEKIRTEALESLASLSSQVERLVAEHIESMSPEVLSYIVQHYQPYLKVNLAEAFKKANAEHHSDALENLFHTG